MIIPRPYSRMISGLGMKFIAYCNCRQRLIRLVPCCTACSTPKSEKPSLLHALCTASGGRCGRVASFPGSPSSGMETLFCMCRKPETKGSAGEPGSKASVGGVGTRLLLEKLEHGWINTSDLVCPNGVLLGDDLVVLVICVRTTYSLVIIAASSLTETRSSTPTQTGHSTLTGVQVASGLSRGRGRELITAPKEPVIG